MQNQAYEEFEKFIKHRTSFWSTLWRNFWAGLARGCGCVTLLIILLLIANFFLNSK